MSFNAAALKLMLDKGLTLGDVVEIAAANEKRADATATERKRRQRAREKEMSHRDVTRDTVSLKEDQNPSGEELPNEAIASLPIRQPISEALGVWNENAAAVGWPTVRSLSPNRAKLLSARLREHGLGGWRETIARARGSPYLAGADPPSWFTFPWLIKAENFLKTSEGNYDRRHSDSPDPTLVALATFRSAGAGH